MVDSLKSISADGLRQCQALLKGEEVEVFSRLTHPRRKREFVVGRALARLGLASLCKTSPEAFRFARQSHGRPFVQNPHPEMSFNLSHCESMVICAFSNRAQVGVDIEAVSRKALTRDIAKRFFSAEEARELAPMDVSEYQNRFFDLWTLKEAYIKATGLGLSLSLKSFAFAFPRPGTISFSRASVPEDAARWQFGLFELPQQIRLALAVE